MKLQLLEGEEMNEAAAALAWLRTLPEVDSTRIAVAGHSFGGSLAFLLAARDMTLRAAVVFGGAAGSWRQSPLLRARLLEAVRRLRAPVFFIHAANDYSIAPGEALAAEMKRPTKPHRLKIYPAVRRNDQEGHNLIYRNVTTREADVFGFLHTHVKHS